MTSLKHIDPTLNLWKSYDLPIINDTISKNFDAIIIQVDQMC